LLSAASPGKLAAMFLHFFYQWASLIALVVAVTVALWRGEWPERVGAAAMIIAWLATPLVQNSLQRWGVQEGVMIVDAGLLAALLYIGLKSDRWWPLWACGFQAMNVVLHVAVLADARVWAWSYFIASSVFSYLVMLALFLGALGRPPRARREA
jgi:hypothetical protein